MSSRYTRDYRPPRRLRRHRPHTRGSPANAVDSSGGEAARTGKRAGAYDGRRMSLYFFAEQHGAIFGLRRDFYSGESRSGCEGHPLDAFTKSAKGGKETLIGKKEKIKDDVMRQRFPNLGKQAKWEEWGDCYWKCSLCGTITMFWPSESGPVFLPVCPGCGAEMTGWEGRKNND